MVAPLESALEAWRSLAQERSREVDELREELHRLREARRKRPWWRFWGQDASQYMTEQKRRMTRMDEKRRDVAVTSAEAVRKGLLGVHDDQGIDSAPGTVGSGCGR